MIIIYNDRIVKAVHLPRSVNPKSLYLYGEYKFLFNGQWLPLVNFRMKLDIMRILEDEKRTDKKNP